MRTVTISQRAAGRARGGHPWIRAADVVSGPSAGRASSATARPFPRAAPARSGTDDDAVAVRDPRGGLVGSALLGPAGSRAADAIALRMYAWQEERPFDRELLARRIDAAIALRGTLFPGADGVRLVHAEADLVPGLFVDRYGDALVLQTSAEALDRREAEIAQLLVERLHPRLVVARDDGSVREREGLPRRTAILHGAPPTRATYHDGAVELAVDVLTGPKTGGFLDQRENHAAAAAYARPGCEALDLFSCHGGFALALAARGANVLAVEQSDAAIAAARGNAARAGLERQVRFEQTDAFDRLRRLEADGARFDVVVLDPPALAKRHAPPAAAERAYGELNLRALRLLREGGGGILVTCSCSAHVTPSDFGAILARAAAAARRPIQVLERRGAGRDHPGLLGAPETEYLKCWIVRAVG